LIPWLSMVTFESFHSRRYQSKLRCLVRKTLTAAIVNLSTIAAGRKFNLPNNPSHSMYLHFKFDTNNSGSTEVSKENTGQGFYINNSPSRVVAILCIWNHIRGNPCL
jgi:hypothetical protein